MKCLKTTKMYVIGLHKMRNILFHGVGEEDRDLENVHKKRLDFPSGGREHRVK